jgi:ribose-phosphate pyrophosphokinase
MICGGTTMVRAAKACAQRGASTVHIAATHGLFTKDAAAKLAVPEIASIVVTDTVTDAASRCPTLTPKLVVLSCVELLSDKLQHLKA